MYINFHFNDCIKKSACTYNPQAVKANSLKVLHDQLFPDVGRPRQQKVWKYCFSFRPNLDKTRNNLLKKSLLKTADIRIITKIVNALKLNNEIAQWKQWSINRRCPHWRLQSPNSLPNSLPNCATNCRRFRRL